MSEKEKILRLALAKFLRGGFLKTSMDSIASELKISKKTIYKHFESKDDLIKAVIEYFTGWLRVQITGIANSDENSVLKLQKISAVLLSTALRVGDGWLNDLNTAGTSYWGYIEEFRTSIIYDNFNKIITQGKREGLIIDEPTILILTIMVSSLRAIINPSFLINNSFSARAAGEKTLGILLSGILSKKGRKLFKQHKPEFENEIKSLFNDHPTTPNIF